MPPYKAKEIIIVMLKSGVVELIRKPKQVRIILRDYDIQCEVEGVTKDEYGNYIESELEQI